MKRESLLTLLRELATPPLDEEVNHGKADDALLEFINDRAITEAYNAIPKWYA